MEKDKSRRVIPVDILAALFGTGSWVCVIGIFVELPLLVQRLPEGWTLPSYISVAVQLSNVGPMVYFLLQRLFPKWITERGGIYAILVVGSGATLLLSLYWHLTSWMFGTDRSTGLIGLTFMLGMVDCSSRVMYPPFMSRFDPNYLVSYYLGEGLSGLIPAMLALVQGVGGTPECRGKFNSDSNSTTYELYSEPPLFSIEAYFCSLLGLFVLSGLAFHLLQYKRIVREALLVPAKVVTSNEQGSRIQSPDAFNPQCGGSDSAIESTGDATMSRKRRRLDSLMLLVILGIVCSILYGLLPSIQSFSCLPYGSTAYNLALALSHVASPVLCCVLLIPRVPKATMRSVGWATGIGLIFSSYAVLTALMSPHPPLVGNILGEIVLIVAWISLNCSFTYVKVGVATLLCRSSGKNGLFWCGVSTQVGVALGSFGTFILVNFTFLFKSYAIQCP